MAKAVALFSGSLASIVATKLVMEERGVEEVRLLHFRSPFFRDYEPIKELAQGLWNVSFRSQSLKKEFHELSDFDNGPYQLRLSCFGCRRLMLRKGLRYMRRVGADFLVTGEVLGKRGLGLFELEEVARQAGVEGLVLRPLSAKLLPETLSEREGWVERDQMQALQEGSGNGLHPLAAELGVLVEEDFPAERRCKLTQSYFGQRLEDLLREKDFTMNSLELLEFPLYYKKPPDVKIILGLDDEEKRRLQTFFLPEDLRIYVPVLAGPMALVRANWEMKSPQDIEEIIELAARIAVAHAPVKGSKIQTNYRFENKSETFRINVSPLPPQELRKYYMK
jgi:hypothetical protein